MNNIFVFAFDASNEKKYETASRLVKDALRSKDVVISTKASRGSGPPGPIFKILDFFGIEPQECFYVGDSLVDYETAKSAGVPFISYKNRGLNTDYHVGYLMEIAGLINSDYSESMSRRR